MIVRLDADGAVVADADDCSAVHVRDRTGLRRPAHRAGAPAPGCSPAPGRPESSSRRRGTALARPLVATAPGLGGAVRRDGGAASGERLTDDGLGLRVPARPPDLAERQLAGTPGMGTTRACNSSPTTPRLEPRHRCGRRPVHDAAVGHPELAAVPRAHDVRLAVRVDDVALVQWRGQVRAAVGEHADPSGPTPSARRSTNTGTSPAVRRTGLPTGARRRARATASLRRRCARSPRRGSRRSPAGSPCGRRAARPRPGDRAAGDREQPAAARPRIRRTSAAA